MLHPDYPFWSFIGFCVVLLPLPWHWRARNVATLALIFWVALSNLVIFINSLVWADNFADHAPVWCDISGRILQIMGYAIPACSLAQMRRLESVASTRRTVITAAQRRRRMWLEAAWCLLFPPLMLPLLYVVQGHRYDIIENMGCQVATHYTWVGIAIKLLLPIAISLAVLIYSALAIRWFLVRRLQFRAILAASHTGLSVSRYLRLIALAVVDVVILLINDIIGLTSSLQSEIDPYKSWGYVHAQYSLVSQFVEAQYSPLDNLVVVIALYAPPLYALIFFIFFGLGEEAISEYVGMYNKVVHLAERAGLKRVAAARQIPAQSLFVPSLGTQTMSATGRPLRDISKEAGSMDDKDDMMFEGVSPREANHGIPILVERSIV